MSEINGTVLPNDIEEALAERAWAPAGGWREFWGSLADAWEGLVRRTSAPSVAVDDTPALRPVAPPSALHSPATAQAVAAAAP